MVTKEIDLEKVWCSTQTFAKAKRRICKMLRNNSLRLPPKEFCSVFCYRRDSTKEVKSKNLKKYDVSNLNCCKIVVLLRSNGFL